MSLHGRRSTQVCILSIALLISGFPSCTGETRNNISSDRLATAFEVPGLPHRFHRLEAGSTVIASNRGGPKHPGRLGLELDLVIGRDSGPQEYLLEFPTQIEVDNSGRIYVVDSRRGQILVYASTGNHLRTMGGSGDGPGETRAGYDIRVFASGLLNAENGLGRIARWGPDGVFRGEKRLKRLLTASQCWFVTTFDGHIIYQFIDPQYGAPADTSRSLWVRRLEGDSGPGELIHRFPRSRPLSASAVYKGDNVGAALPYATSLRSAFFPDGGLAFADPDSACVEIFEQSFEKVLDIRWEAAAVPLSEAEYQRGFQETRPTSQATEFSGVFANTYEWTTTLAPPPYKPRIASMVAGLDHHLWVERWGEGAWGDRLWKSEPDSTYDYWVFSRDGELEYQTSLPFRVKAADGDHLYEILRSEDQGPRIRRWRWSPPD